MITPAQGKKIALTEKKGLVIVNAVKYRNYYVFFMQPKGVDPYSQDALLDSYVVVNYETGKIEYRSILMFENFVEESKPII